MSPGGKWGTSPEWMGFPSSTRGRGKECGKRRVGRKGGSVAQRRKDFNGWGVETSGPGFGLGVSKGRAHG